MRIYWSRCKLGPSRVYWIVGVFFEDEIVADGYTATIEQAEEQAGKVAGPEASQVQAYYAESRHRRKAHESRMSRPARSSGAEARRYVYEACTSDYDGHRYALAYPVLKWTAKRVYVSPHSFFAEHVGTEMEPAVKHGPDDTAFVLDRKELESEGHADTRFCWWRGPYYLRLEDALGSYGGRHAGPPDAVIEALTDLGLTWPCTLREVRDAYRRRSWETHPDAGGDAGSFVRVKDAHDVAVAGLANWPAFDRAGTPT